MNNIKGIYAASMSVLNENLTLNIDKTIDHAEMVIDQGCHGAAIFGSTGQAQLIPISEKINLLNKLATNKYKDKYLIGTGLNSLGDTINLMRVAKSLNFEKFLIMPPGYKFSVGCVKELVKRFPNQIVGVKDSSYNLFENLKLDNFSVMPGSESKLLKGLELGCSGIITATCNATAGLARKVYDDFSNGTPQTVNEKLCEVRGEFEKYKSLMAA